MAHFTSISLENGFQKSCSPRFAESEEPTDNFPSSLIILFWRKFRLSSYATNASSVRAPGSIPPNSSTTTNLVKSRNVGKFPLLEYGGVCRAPNILGTLTGLNAPSSYKVIARFVMSMVPGFPDKPWMNNTFVVPPSGWQESQLR